MTRIGNIGIAFGLAGVLVVGGAQLSTASVTASAPVSGLTASSQAAVHVAAKPKPKKYKNCKALNKVYKHGVARKGAEDKVRGKTDPVTDFTVSTKTYNLNKKSDRDKDGVACEKQ